MRPSKTLTLKSLLACTAFTCMPLTAWSAETDQGRQILVADNDHHHGGQAQNAAVGVQANGAQPGSNPQFQAHMSRQPQGQFSFGQPSRPGAGRSGGSTWQSVFGPSQQQGGAQFGRMRNGAEPGAAQNPWNSQSFWQSSHRNRGTQHWDDQNNAAIGRYPNGIQQDQPTRQYRWSGQNSATEIGNGRQRDYNASFNRSNPGNALSSGEVGNRNTSWNRDEGFQRRDRDFRFREGFDAREFERNEWSDHRFNAGRYWQPEGWYYRRWVYGEYLPDIFWTQNYWIGDYYDFGLDDPPPGFVWVRYGADALLIDEETGQILQVLYGLFY